MVLWDAIPCSSVGTTGLTCRMCFNVVHAVLFRKLTLYNIFMSTVSQLLHLLTASLDCLNHLHKL